jgi:hypothetical protein
MNKKEKEKLEEIVSFIDFISGDVLWDSESNREQTKESFIMPEDLKRVCRLLDEISVRLTIFINKN